LPGLRLWREFVVGSRLGARALLPLGLWPCALSPERYFQGSKAQGKLNPVLFIGTVL